MFEYIEEKKRLIDHWLETRVPKVKPDSLWEAINYALFPGGKRIRPVLCIAAAEVCNAKAEDVLACACAIEMIHTYSLIHDDLPCMDDDDFRRGKPTVHKKFGEALAVLAGDGLLTLAFEVLTDPNNYPDPSLPKILWVTNEIAKAAGIKGMVAGQVADIEAENRKPTPEMVDFIHLHKTAKMIEVSLKSGAILAGAGYREIERLSEYGRLIGIAFQIIDDVLGEIGSEEKLKKPVKRDREKGKATYPAVWGIEKSKQKAKSLIEEAKQKLKIFESEKCWMLRELADYIVKRES
ncbi:MAG: polyprenyl synthetase family protein [Deferribacteres bacterium]|nr:polyprenyl synthetase family protein [Deferribacteres bacterium]